MFVGPVRTSFAPSHHRSQVPTSKLYLRMFWGSLYKILWSPLKTFLHCPPKLSVLITPPLSSPVRMLNLQTFHISPLEDLNKLNLAGGSHCCCSPFSNQVRVWGGFVQVTGLLAAVWLTAPFIQTILTVLVSVTYQRLADALTCRGPAKTFALLRPIVDSVD